MDIEQETLLDYRALGRRIARGAAQSIGLALIGLAIGAVGCLATLYWLPISTSARVVFSFPGSGNGRYPDKSKFEPGDLVAPDVVAAALKLQGFDDSSANQSRIRASLNVEGIIPPDVTKAHDHILATGQVPPPFIPDEYAVTLTLPHTSSLNERQRSLLLSGIVDAYRGKFERTYSDVPSALGSAFATLQEADYFEYEDVLSAEVRSIRSYLVQQIAQAANFRSMSTNCSFDDLLNQTEIFSRLKANATLGLIRQYGLSHDRKMAITKLDYYLGTLANQEQRASENEKVIQGLLLQTASRAQGYVLGIKSQTTQRPDTAIMDEGLIDSLLANDSYNFLVRKALDAGLEVKRIQSEEAEMLERRKIIEGLMDKDPGDQATQFAEVNRSLAELRKGYEGLILNIRQTQTDFAHQQFADSIRISGPIRSDGMLYPSLRSGGVGAALGLALGLGLSLVGVYLGKRAD